MPRTKSSRGQKSRLDLSIDAQTKLNLDFLRDNTGMSISEMLALWADSTSKKLSKEIGKPIPQAKAFAHKNLFSEE